MNSNRSTSLSSAEVSTPPAQPDDLVPLKVAILYDGIPAGRRALSTIKRMLDQAEPVHLIPSLWRFDLLEDLACRSQVTAEAIGADLLILATDRGDTLPASIEHWLNDFLLRRRGSPVSILTMWGVDEQWNVSLFERNAAGRIQPMNCTQSQAAEGRVALYTNPLEAAVAA